MVMAGDSVAEEAETSQALSTSVDDFADWMMRATALKGLFNDRIFLKHRRIVDGLCRPSNSLFLRGMLQMPF